MTTERDERLPQVRAIRARLQAQGPARSRPLDNDFARVSVPAHDCDVLRDALIAEGARAVIEIGLAYASSALAIGEALLVTGGPVRHLIIDPYQESSYAGVGWQAVCAAGLDRHSAMILEPSSIALPRLVSEGFIADAAFVDGSHRFHEVFVDLYFLRKLVRPSGLIILDDAEWPSVATALRYYDLHLGWDRVHLPGRLAARRLPAEPFEPSFEDFKPFSPVESPPAD